MNYPNCSVINLKYILGEEEDKNEFWRNDIVSLFHWSGSFRCSNASTSSSSFEMANIFLVSGSDFERNDFKFVGCKSKNYASLYVP